jgi:hypothetical protein
LLQRKRFKTCNSNKSGSMQRRDETTSASVCSQRNVQGSTRLSWIAIVRAKVMRRAQFGCATADGFWRERNQRTHGEIQNVASARRLHRGPAGWAYAPQDVSAGCHAPKKSDDGSAHWYQLVGRRCHLNLGHSQPEPLRFLRGQRPDHVVPFRMERVAMNVEVLHLGSPAGLRASPRRRISLENKRVVGE